MQSTEAFRQKNPQSQRLGRLAQAHSASQRVNPQQLQAEQPNFLPGRKPDRVASWHRASGFLVNLSHPNIGDFNEVECASKKLTLTGQLMAAASDPVRNRAEAAISHGYLARDDFPIGRCAKAYPILRKAVEACLKLIDNHPRHRRLYVLLLGCTSLLAVANARINQPTEALKVLDEGLLAFDASCNAATRAA